MLACGAEVHVWRKCHLLRCLEAGPDNGCEQGPGDGRQVVKDLRPDAARADGV